jgi:DNA replication protein DnaC
MGDLAEVIRRAQASWVAARRGMPEPEPELERVRSIHGCPSTYDWATVDAPAWRRLVGPVVVRQVESLAASPRRMMAVLGSASGVGKTASAVALSRAIAPDGAGVFARASALCSAAREAGYGHTADDVHRARTARLLVIDDLGVESTSEANRELLCELVWSRADSERRGRVTICTSALSAEQMGQRYGEGMARRICSLASVRVGG